MLKIDEWELKAIVDLLDYANDEGWKYFFGKQSEIALRVNGKELQNKLERVLYPNGNERNNKKEDTTK